MFLIYIYILNMLDNDIYLIVVFNIKLLIFRIIIYQNIFKYQKIIIYKIFIIHIFSFGSKFAMKIIKYSRTLNIFYTSFSY